MTAPRRHALRETVARRGRRQRQYIASWLHGCSSRHGPWQALHCQRSGNQDQTIRLPRPGSQQARSQACKQCRSSQLKNLASTHRHTRRKKVPLQNREIDIYRTRKLHSRPQHHPRLARREQRRVPVARHVVADLARDGVGRLDVAVAVDPVPLFARRLDGRALGQLELGLL